VALGLAFLSGLLPGLYAQAELAQPGLQVVGRESDYNLAISFHILALAGLMPLIGIALALAVIAEVRESRIAQFGAIVALAAALLAAIALVVISAPRNDFPVLSDVSPGLSLLSVYMPDLLMLAQAALGVGVLAVLAVFGRGRRRAVVVFAALSAIAILLAVSLELTLLNSGIDHALHDTFFNVAANHMAGVAIALNIFGALAAWSIRWEGMKRLWFSLATGIAVLVTGTFYVAAATGLGLMGMPRKYVDYTPAFARYHWIHTIWSMVFAGMLVAAIVWLAIAVWRAKRPPGVETAFE